MDDGTISREERTMGVACHLASLVGFFIGPLVVWLLKKDTMPFVDEQGREALNFQITLAIAYVVGSVLVLVGIGALIVMAAFVMNIVFSITAAVRINDGISYRYPFALRIL